MAWVRFNRDYDHRLGGSALIAFKADRAYSVKKDVAAAVVATGAAERIATPQRVRSAEGRPDDANGVRFKDGRPADGDGTA